MSIFLYLLNLTAKSNKEIPYYPNTLNLTTE